MIGIAELAPTLGRVRRAAGLALLGVAVAITVGIMSAAIALAHAEPGTVTPGNGAVLNVPPTQVVIETTQDMARVGDANDIVVVDANGTVVTTGPATVDNIDRRKLTQSLPPGLAVGVYTIKWKTLSADDGDAADGTFTFTYDPSKPPSPGTVTVFSVATAAPTVATATVPIAVQAPATGNVPSTQGESAVSDWELVALVGFVALVVGSGSTLWWLRR